MLLIYETLWSQHTVFANPGGRLTASPLFSNYKARRVVQR